MPTLQQYLEQIESCIVASIEKDDPYAFQDPIYDIMDEIGQLKNAPDAVESVFRLIEKYPNIEYGGPGPLGSFLERQDGYETLLLESLERKPKDYTTFLLSRMAGNTQNVKSAQYKQVLRRYIDSEHLSGEWRDYLMESYGDQSE